MQRSKLLFVDALIDLVLGLVLMAFPEGIIAAAGLPPATQIFYPSILGTVLFGLGLALLIEYGRKPGGLPGLGLGGAATVNICSGVALAIWQLAGGLFIPLRGQLLLWCLCFVLVVLGLAQMSAYRRNRDQGQD